jgi:hypothetical protein
MFKTVEVDTIDRDAGEESDEVSGNHPPCVRSGHKQGPQVDKMIDQNLWCPDMPLSMNEDGMVQYQPGEGTYQD